MTMLYDKHKNRHISIKRDERIKLSSAYNSVIVRSVVNVSAPTPIITADDNNVVIAVSPRNKHSCHYIVLLYSNVRDTKRKTRSRQLTADNRFDVRCNLRQWKIVENRRQWLCGDTCAN